MSHDESLRSNFVSYKELQNVLMMLGSGWYPKWVMDVPKRNGRLFHYETGSGGGRGE